MAVQKRLLAPRDDANIPSQPQNTAIMNHKTDHNTIEQMECRGKPKAVGVDDTFNFAVAGSDVIWSDEEEKRVRWKIDLVILPLLLFSGLVTYTDSQAYGFAALFGLVVDLKLYAVKVINGTATLDLSRYSFSSGIIQLGAVAAQYPLLALAQYFSYGKFISAWVIYTGLVAILTIVSQDYSDILALRFFAGLSVVTQSLSIIITSMWWRRNEQPLRVGLFIGGSAIGNLVGQAVDLGAVDIQGAFAGHTWKWIYVILGSVTMGYGLMMFFMFPGSPMTAWFLTPRERIVAVRRLVGNNTGTQTRKFKWKQVREAFTDPQLYLLGVYAFSFSFANAAIGTFGGFLVTSFGFEQRHALKLTMPASAVAFVSMASSGALGSYFPRRRLLIAMLYILPSIAGSCMLWKLPRSNVAGLLAGLYISTTFYGALVQQFSLLAANVAGHTKKSTMNATIVLLANMGAFAGPWAYKGSEANEGYPTGQIAGLSLLSASLAAFVILWVYYSYQNKKKAAYRAEHPELVDDPTNALVDHTDQENPIFQYKL